MQTHNGGDCNQWLVRTHAHACTHTWCSESCGLVKVSPHCLKPTVKAKMNHQSSLSLFTSLHACHFSPPFLPFLLFTPCIWFLLSFFLLCCLQDTVQLFVPTPNTIVPATVWAYVGASLQACMHAFHQKSHFAASPTFSARNRSLCFCLFLCLF